VRHAGAAVERGGFSAADIAANLLGIRLEAATAASTTDTEVCGLWGMLPEEVRAVNGDTCDRCCPFGFAEQCSQLCCMPYTHTLQLLEIILRQCGPAQLAMLESTCQFFRSSKLLERIAKHKLKAVPRARGLRPCRK
jgi:hypothetical protein